MCRPHRVTLVLALALVTAGCGAPSAGGGPATATERLTAAPLPEGTPQRLAPGVTSSGVVDATALKDAHVAKLRGGDFTLRSERVERYANGSLRARTRLRAAFPGDGRYLVERSFEGPVHDRLGTGGSVLEYGDANRTVRLRVTTNGSVGRRSVGPPPHGPVPRTALLTAPFRGRTVLLVLRGVDVDAVVPVDGRAAFRLQGSGVANRSALRSLLSPTLVESVREISVEATVTADGLVASLRFTYTVDHDGVPVEITRTVRFVDVGTTALDRPAWATPPTPSARNVTTATQATGVRSTTVPS